MSSHMLKTVAGLLVGAAFLAGCGSTTKDHLKVGSIDDYRTNHPIIVSEREQTLDVPVASGARELNLATQSNITAFAGEFERSGTGVLHMLVPANSANQHAVNRVKDDILDAIEAGGGTRHDVSIQTYDASHHDKAAPVRLSYFGVTAATPKPCGQWPDDVLRMPDNRHHADFGCSSQTNLAAQIENPGDLLGPRDMTSIDAEQRGAVISDYQDGPAGKASEVNY